MPKIKSTPLGECIFACTKCSDRFSTSANLRTHERTHVVNGTLPAATDRLELLNICTFCNKRFLRMNELNKHIRIHTGDQSLVCLKCEKIFADHANLRKHQANNMCDLDFKCTECNKRYPTESGLAKHKRVHFFERPYTCEKCPQRFKHVTDLDQHVCNQRSDDCSVLNFIIPVPTDVLPASSVLAVIPNVNEQKEEKKPNATEISEYPFACKQCNYQFSTLLSLRKHELTHARKRQSLSGDSNQPSQNNTSTPTRDESVKREYLDDGDSLTLLSTVQTFLNVVPFPVAQVTNETGGLLPVFKCTECDKEYPTEFGYNKHKRVHYFERPYVCKKCPQRFKSSADLNEHVCTVPLDDCSFLSSPKTQNGIVQTKKTSDVVENNLQHNSAKITDHPFVCTRCNYQFSTQSALRQHEQTHARKRKLTPEDINQPSHKVSTHIDADLVKREPLDDSQNTSQSAIGKTFLNETTPGAQVTNAAGEVVFKCSECDKDYPNEFTYNKHKRIHYFERPYVCRNCPQRFKSSSDLKEHVCAVPLDECSFLSRIETKNEIAPCATMSSKIEDALQPTASDTASNDEKPYPCLQCPKRFSKSKSLHLHERVHSNERQFSCTKCDKHYTLRSTLMNHQRVHTEDYPHACTKCDRRFRTDVEMRKHERGAHSDQLKYPCTRCAETFDDLSKLHRHLHSHSYEEPCVCSECGKKFAHEPALNKHASTHCADQPYTCSRCPEKFKLSGELKEHERVHSGPVKYPCDKCGETFEDSSKLRRHAQSHGKRRSWECSECGKKFAHEQALNKHVAMHYFDRPYTCSNCPERFKLSAELKEHDLIHVKRELDTNSVNERDFHLPQFSDVAPLPVTIKTELPDSEEEEEDENHLMNFDDSSFENKSLISLKSYTDAQCEEKCALSDEFNVSNESDHDVLLPRVSDEASSAFIKTEIPDYHEDETEAMNLTIADIDSAFRNETLSLPDVKPEVSKLTQSCVSFDWARIKIEPNEANAPVVN